MFLSEKCCFEFHAFDFEALLLAYIAYPWIFTKTVFDFVSRNLDFEIESWLYHLVISNLLPLETIQILISLPV